MNELKDLTQWFDYHTKPVHIGVYQTQIIDSYEKTGYSWWHGGHWGNQYPTPSLAEIHRDGHGWQGKFWRGLLNP